MDEIKQPKNDLASLLRDFAQGASNSAATNLSMPVDAIAWLLRKGGMNIPNNPVGGSDWLAEKGFTPEPKNKLAGLLGDVAGFAAPLAAVTKAPQIAKGLLQMGEAMPMGSKGVPPLSKASPMADRGAIVWHGSPHKFDAFDASKIGTGEGAQAYGHGLYLAESPNVARTYSSDRAYVGAAMKGKPIPINYDDPAWIAQTTIEELGDAAKAKAHLEMVQRTAGKYQPPETKAAVQGALDLIESGGVSPKGNVYKVDLPDEHIAKMLDYDLPLSEQSSLLSALGIKHPSNLKGSPQGVSGASNAVGDGLIGQSVSPQGNSLSDINLRGQMMPSMFGSSKDNKVLDSVVGLDSVDMMNFLPSKQLSTNAALNNKSMFFDGLPVNTNNDVASAVGMGGVDSFHIPSIAELGQNATGKDLYNKLASLGSDKASALLREKGITGIKYLDQGSRAAGVGSSNYVVFPGNERLLKILERNGQKQ